MSMCRIVPLAALALALAVPSSVAADTPSPRSLKHRLAGADIAIAELRASVDTGDSARILRDLRAASAATAATARVARRTAPTRTPAARTRALALSGGAHDRLLQALTDVLSSSDPRVQAAAVRAIETVAARRTLIVDTFERLLPKAPERLRAAAAAQLASLSAAQVDTLEAIMSALEAQPLAPGVELRLTAVVERSYAALDDTLARLGAVTAELPADARADADAALAAITERAEGLEPRVEAIAAILDSVAEGTTTPEQAAEAIGAEFVGLIGEHPLPSSAPAGPLTGIVETLLGHATGR